MDKIVIDPTENVVAWAIDRINDLIDKDTKESKSQAMALIGEYQEWIDSIQDDEEIKYIVIRNKENEGWTEEQEIDIQDPWT